MSEDHEILPTVLVIHPSGYTEFLDADVSSMTSSEIESLIYGQDLELLHSSEQLTRITKECTLEKNLVMCFARKAKDTEDNYVGSFLYDEVMQVRGPIIIALEDDENKISSFNNEEDIENGFSRTLCHCSRTFHGRVCSIGL